MVPDYLKILNHVRIESIFRSVKAATVHKDDLARILELRKDPQSLMN